MDALRNLCGPEFAVVHALQSSLRDLSLSTKRLFLAAEETIRDDIASVAACVYHELRPQVYETRWGEVCEWHRCEAMAEFLRAVKRFGVVVELQGSFASAT